MSRRGIRCRCGTVAVLLCAWVSPSAGQAVSQPGDAREIVKKSVERDRINFSRARDYTYVQRAETRHLDKSGKVTKTESNTWDVVMIGERPYRKRIAHNDRALTAEEAREAEQSEQKAERERAKETAEERRKRAERAYKEQERARAFIAEIPEAFDFQLVGEESLEAMAVWVITSRPKAGYRPRTREARILTKFRGTLWIDKQDYQWVKVEAEAVDTVTFGLVLARVSPGTRVTFQQSRVNQEVWLPSRATTRLDARLALFKKIRAEVDVRWTNYRRFQTDSRVVSVEEAPPPVKP